MKEKWEFFSPFRVSGTTPSLLLYCVCLIWFTEECFFLSSTHQKLEDKSVFVFFFCLPDLFHLTEQNTREDNKQTQEGINVYTVSFWHTSFYSSHLYLHHHHHYNSIFITSHHVKPLHTAWPRMLFHLPKVGSTCLDCDCDWLSILLWLYSVDKSHALSVQVFMWRKDEWEKYGKLLFIYVGNITWESKTCRLFSGFRGTILYEVEKRVFGADRWDIHFVSLCSIDARNQSLCVNHVNVLSLHLLLEREG